jgi:hypothetical protein
MALSRKAIGFRTGRPGDAGRTSPEPAQTTAQKSSPCQIGPVSTGTTPPPSGPPSDTTLVTSGIDARTISTRRYCISATSPASAPASALTTTTPEAPPAIVPNTPVGRSIPVTAASANPLATVSTSAAATAKPSARPYRGPRG